MLAQMRERLIRCSTFERAIWAVLDDTIALHGAECGTVQLLSGDEFCALFLPCGRRSDRISAGIALIAFVTLVSLGALLAHCAFLAFLALRSLGTRRTWIALRTFKTSRESERCNQRTYQG